MIARNLQQVADSDGLEGLQNGFEVPRLTAEKPIVQENAMTDRTLAVSGQTGMERKSWVLRKLLAIYVMTLPRKEAIAAI